MENIQTINWSKTPTTLQEAAINIAIEDFSTKCKLFQQDSMSVAIKKISNFVIKLKLYKNA